MTGSCISAATHGCPVCRPRQCRGGDEEVNASDSDGSAFESPGRAKKKEGVRRARPHDGKPLRKRATDMEWEPMPGGEDLAPKAADAFYQRYIDDNAPGRGMNKQGKVYTIGLPGYRISTQNYECAYKACCTPGCFFRMRRRTQLDKPGKLVTFEQSLLREHDHSNEDEEHGAPGPLRPPSLACFPRARHPALLPFVFPTPLPTSHSLPLSPPWVRVTLSFFGKCSCLPHRGHSGALAISY